MSKLLQATIWNGDSHWVHQKKKVLEMSYTIEWPKGREIELDLGVGNTIEIK